MCTKDQREMFQFIAHNILTDSQLDTRLPCGQIIRDWKNNMDADLDGLLPKFIKRNIVLQQRNKAMKEALEALTDAIDLSKLKPKKDFRLLVCHAQAVKVLAEGKDPL